tara:strand:+ start:781 stop:1488 length:708 start_codon:yes stop_codon:yes gene_type:complete
MNNNCLDLNKKKCQVKSTVCVWELKPLELGKKRRTGYCKTKLSTIKSLPPKVDQSKKSNMVKIPKVGRPPKKSKKVLISTKSVQNNIPFIYIGNYNSKDHLTTIKGYADKNKTALVLYSANSKNNGPWNKSRAIGYGQATNVHTDTLWAKQTYGIFAGPFSTKEEALKTIKNSLNEAFKYFNKNKERFTHIAHPGTNTNTGYYGGIWSKFMNKKDRFWLNKSIIEYIQTRKFILH